MILLPTTTTATMDPAGSKQQRRWSVGRSSTSRSHFSPRSSEAFYASAEPLSGRGGRALHNASGGGGPDPDSNSAPDSCAAPEAARSSRQYRTSVRQDSPKDRRAAAIGDREPFHTVPRGLAISRREILRRRCGKDEEEAPPLEPKKEQLERPRTLPTIGRRSRQEAEHASSLLKRVSRQDILRRRASAEAKLKADPAKLPSNFQSSGRWAKEERDLPRPSTLPKILHASRTSSRLDDYAAPRTREPAGREAPIYGRIRRRKMSLPTGATSLRDSATSLGTLTRFSKTKTGGERAAEASKAVRHLRDPVPDPPSRPKYVSDVSGDDIIYAKVARKVPRQASSQDHEEKQESVDLKTVSRRRIISNVNHTDSFERRTHQDRDQDVVQVKRDAILVSKADFERVRNFKVRKNDSENTSAPARVSSSESRKDSKTDSWSSRNRCPRTDFTSTNERQVRCRSKSQSGLLMESPKAAVRPTTLPSYVKIGRKTSTGPSTKDANEQRRTSNAGSLTKQTKERTNYVKKTATRVPTHVRAFSDANSVRSCSPATSSSIFGFCTGKRKVQPSSVSRSSPSWNLSTV